MPRPNEAHVTLRGRLLRLRARRSATHALATLTRFLKLAVGSCCLLSGLLLCFVLVSTHRESSASHSCINLYPLDDDDILNVTIKSSLHETILSWAQRMREQEYPDSPTAPGPLLLPDVIAVGVCPVKDQFHTETHAVTALIQQLAGWYLTDTNVLYAKDIGILQLSNPSKVKFNVSTRSITLYSSHPCLGRRHKYIDLFIWTPSLLLMQLSHAFGSGGALVFEGEDQLLFPIQTPVSSVFGNKSLNAADLLQDCTWCTWDFAWAMASAAVHKVDFILEIAAATLLLAANAEIIHYATRQIVIISIFVSQMLQLTSHSRQSRVVSRAITLHLLNVLLTSSAACVLTVLLMDELLSHLVTGITLFLACLFKAASGRLNGIVCRQLFKIYLIHVSLIYAYVLQYPFPLICLAICIHLFFTCGGYLLLVVFQELLDLRANDSPPAQTVFIQHQHAEDQGNHQNVDNFARLQ
jgi:hypothetical protein